MYRKSKYGNRKVKALGKKFDSKLEYHRYLVLKEAQDKGLIQDLETQKKFVIIPASFEPVLKTVKGKLKEDRKCVERATSYLADFAYIKDGKIVVEDTKSEATRKKESYIIKRKLMLSVHGIKVREITSATEEI